MFIIEIVMPNAAAQMHPIMVLFKYVFLWGWDGVCVKANLRTVLRKLKRCKILWFVLNDFLHEMTSLPISSSSASEKPQARATGIIRFETQNSHLESKESTFFQGHRCKKSLTVS